MRKVFVVLFMCFLVLGPLTANAGLIHGTIREKGNPVTNRSITIICPDGTRFPTSTDNQGDYRVFVKCEGRCDLQVGGIAQSVTIYSSNNPVRYDFEIRLDQNGRAVLLRQ